MKLINPTDEQLNKLLAEKYGIKWHRPTNEEMESGSYYSYWPDYCRSEDSVASLLGHHYCEINHFAGLAGERPLWRVSVEGSPGGIGATVSDKSLARAAVLALLAVNGVEVEFIE